MGRNIRRLVTGKRNLLRLLRIALRTRAKNFLEKNQIEPCPPPPRLARYWQFDSLRSEIGNSLARYGPPRRGG
jgi:hypothetical protein